MLPVFDIVSVPPRSSSLRVTNSTTIPVVPKGGVRSTYTLYTTGEGDMETTGVDVNGGGLRRS